MAQNKSIHKITIEAIDAELRRLNAKLEKVKNNGNVDSAKHILKIQKALENLKNEMAGENQ